MLIVISANRPSVEISQETNYPLRIRTLGNQISDRNELITVLPARLLEQVFELFAAAMNVPDDESAHAHDLILSTAPLKTKFVVAGKR